MKNGFRIMNPGTVQPNLPVPFYPFPKKYVHRKVMAMEIDFEADAFDEGSRLRDVIRGHKGFSS